MKKLFLVLVVFLLALTVGCQEYTVTGPEELSSNNNRIVSKREESNFNIHKPSKDRVINIMTELKDPVLNVSIQLRGKITFDHQIIPSISNQDIAKKTVRLNLRIESELVNRFVIAYGLWKIAGKSSHKFFFDKTKDNVQLLKVTYRITNRKNVKLQVTYPVTADGLEQPTFKLIQLFIGPTAN